MFFDWRSPITTETIVMMMSTITIGEKMYSMPSAKPLRKRDAAIWTAWLV